MTQTLDQILPATAGAGMKFVRIVEGPDGNAFFEPFSLEQEGLKPPTVWKRRASTVMVNVVPAGVSVPYHNSADTGAGTLLVLLKGLAVYWVDNGGECGKSYYPHAPGTVFWGLDSGGRGHGGMVLEDAVVLQVHLAPEE